MSVSTFFASRRVKVIFVIAVAIVAVGGLAAFEPVTRSFVAQDATCLFCHEDSDYNAATKVLWDGLKPLTKSHKATPEGGQASCVACHVPEGILGSGYFYTHALTFTDFFGRMHPSLTDRYNAPWVAPVARRAFIVRDGMLENDSSPCRSCHIESEIKPKRKRGQKAHKNALKNKETCIECHDSLVHREVPPRDEFFKNAGQPR